MKNNTMFSQNNKGEVTIPKAFRQYLERRGLKSEEDLYGFLYPSMKDLPKPAEMLNLPAAARLVADYISAGKQIIIWGDYDVDGTTGTALLVNFIRELDGEVNWHIPDRLKEGYGLNAHWFTDPTNRLLNNDFLLITVDCGISNGREIESIKKMGGTVIVTDHHSLPETSLPACQILNPSQPDCGFHGHQLAGVGVAFYLAAAIRAEFASRFPGNRNNKINLKKYLAFVAIGTIADVVELTSTNRILVRAGFEALEQNQFTGLGALLTSCDISKKRLSSEDIGFLVGPKINAAGRLGDSRIVVELLTEQEPKRATKLSQSLTDINVKRKTISAENLETALSCLSISKIEEHKCAIAKGNIHQGVAGIVASRLVDIFKVPAIVFAKNIQRDGALHFIGSARSVDGINIVELLNNCSKWIEKFGGHAMAAGLTIAEGKMDLFEQTFEALAKRAMSERVVQPRTAYDILCPVELTMNKEHLDCLTLLEPFGPCNPQPVFQDPSVLIVDSRTVGQEAEHLQLTIRGKQSNFKGIGFGLGAKQKDIQRTPQRNMLYTPTMNRFRGNVSWQVRVIDI